MYYFVSFFLKPKSGGFTIRNCKYMIAAGTPFDADEFHYNWLNSEAGKEYQGIQVINYQQITKEAFEYKFKAPKEVA